MSATTETTGSHTMRGKVLPEQRADRVWLFLSLCAFAIGIVLRYRFICVENRPSDAANILGDADWYVGEAVHFFDPTRTTTLYDTLFPPGAPFYFACLLRLDPTRVTLDAVQCALACLLPIILAFTTFRLFGLRRALFVLTFSSLYFPLWELFGYVLSEGPFLVTMFSSFLLLVLSLQSRSSRGAALFGFLAGLCLGASAACKSCALLSGLLVAVVIAAARRETRFRLGASFCAAVVGLATILVPTAIHATRMNEGHFLLIANDSPRTFLLGHQGRVGLTWWIDEPRHFHMNFTNPSTSQHGYTESKTYPFGPYEVAPNYAAGWKWIRENPGDALLLSIEHVFDLFTVFPWPGYFRSYARWTIFFNEAFLALLLLPALIHLVRSRRRLASDPAYMADRMALAACASIYLVAFIFLGEGRYRVCYDGFLMMLASRAFIPRPEAPFPFPVEAPAGAEPR